MAVAGVPMVMAGLILADCSRTQRSESAQEAASAPLPPVSQEQLNAPKEIVINNDAFSSFFSGALKTKEDLQKFVDKFKDTDLTIIEWCLGPCGGVFTFDTKVGDVLGDGITEEVYAKLRRGDRLAAETVHRLIAEGNDPLAIVAEQGKKDGIEIFASLRMCPFYGPPYDVFLNGSFWRNNQDKRIVDINGRVVSPHLSYAYPEVRQFWLDILAEAAQRDIMGINLDYLRHPPFFGFEKLLVEGFKARYGVNPPGKNPELWWRYRAEFMTDFVRKLRAQTDEAAKRLGHPIRISARVDHNDYLKQGLDIETWIKEGLIDILIVSEHGLGGFEFDLAPFRKMCAGTTCKLFFGEETITAGHDLTPEEDRRLARGEKLKLERGSLSTRQFAERALRWYSEGADGIHIFNGPGDIETLKILGSVEKIKAYLKEHPAPQ